MSAVVQLAFGSFGDIVALLQLIAELCTALQAARDSSDDIRALVDDLRAFSCAIDEVKIALERRHTALRPGLLDGITKAVSLCHTMLRDVQRRIDRFNQRRLRAIGPVVWGKYLAACAWTICGEKRVVATLKQRMWEQLELVHTMLAISQANDQDGLISAINSQKASLSQLHQSIRGLSYLSDGFPPFCFFDKDGSRFKPILQMTSETFHALSSCQPWGQDFTIPPDPDGGPVNKVALRMCLGVVAPEREMYWIYHRSAISGPLMVVLGLPCILWDPNIYDLVRDWLARVPNVTMFPSRPSELEYQSAEESVDNGDLPVIHFLFPALNFRNTIEPATSSSAPLVLRKRDLWHSRFQEVAKDIQEVLNHALEYLEKKASSSDFPAIRRQTRRIFGRPLADYFYLGFVEQVPCSVFHKFVIDHLALAITPTVLPGRQEAGLDPPGYRGP